MNEYTQKRFDQLAEDVAVTRIKVEAIEKSLCRFHTERLGQETRISQLEKKVFSLFFIGPVLLGGVAFMSLFVNTFKTWLIGK